MKRTPVFLLITLLALGLVLVACDTGASTPVAQQECPTCPACPQGTACPECPAAGECPTTEACAACPTAEACPQATACPECPAGAAVDCPNYDVWSNSAHAAADAPAFTHWNDEGEIPTSCARCHSTPGYLDYLGADGSAFGTVDAAAPIGTVINCTACHNEVTATDLNTVTFPSGVEVGVEDPSARCMVCHQGRAWGGSITQAVEDAGLADQPDTVSADLSFVNIHYYAAAATLYGSITHGGYEYEGESYDTRLSHVSAFDTCAECHNPHSLEVRTEQCAQCHPQSDLHDIRMPGSLVDYDGDGNTDEGIYYEIQGLQEMLYTDIQAYASEVAGTPVVYDVNSHPYWFADANGNGAVDEGEEAYASWTPRMLAAAYNYHTTIKDPGGFAHGGKYFIELLHDSIASLNEQVANPIDLTNAARIDAGHFAGSEEAFRHWDEEGMVPADCARCHSATGLPFYIKHGVQIEQPLSNGLACETCHSNVQTFELYQIEQVTFPSGATVSLEDNSNLCITCHQGRTSTATVNQAVEGLAPNEVAQLRFINIHYFAAGATLFGSEVHGAYEYADKAYVGRFQHVDPYNTCVECHNVHALTVKIEDCTVCHDVESVTDIRMSNVDYDGDGNTTEGIAGEVQTMQEALYAAMQAYATSTDGVDPIEYNPDAYPYFFNGAGDQYATWTPTLLEAAYNLQYVQKDTGAFAHNGKYIIQILYDGIQSLGGDVSGMTRPETPQ